MTAILSCVCGKYDESQDLVNDFKDKNGPLNKHVLFLWSLCKKQFPFLIAYHFKLFNFVQRINNPPIT